MASLALQLCVIENELEKDFRGTLEKVKEMGYEGIEFSGLMGHSPKEIREICDEIGLVPISGMVSYEECVADLEKVIDDYTTIGCKYIVTISSATRKFLPYNERFEEFVETLNRVGKRAKESGMTLLLHNHCRDFLQVDGKYAIDIFLERVPTDIFAIEIDTLSVTLAKVDAPAYMRTQKGRIPIVHIRDFFCDIAAHAPDLAAPAHPLPHDLEFRPLGYGIEDVPALIEASRDVGAEWLIFETHGVSMGFSALEIAKMGIDYLKAHGC